MEMLQFLLLATVKLIICIFVVYGALLGVQKGRSVEICNSFELLVNAVDGQAVLDKEYFTAKEEQCKLCLYVRQGSQLLAVLNFSNARDCVILFFILHLCS